MPAATPAARPRTTTAGSGSVPMRSPAGFVAPHPAATHPAAAASIPSPVGGPATAPSMPASTAPTNGPALTTAPTKAPVLAPTTAPAPSLPPTPSPSPTPVTVTHHS
jgi:hypothetical protein